MCRAPTFCPVEAARSHSLVTVTAGGVTPDPTMVSHELGQDAAQGRGSKCGARRGPGTGSCSAPSPPITLAIKGSYF